MEKIDGPKLKPWDTYQQIGDKPVYIIFPKGDNFDETYIALGERKFICSTSARKSATKLAALMAGAGMVIGGLGVGASYSMAEREAEQNPLELTCEQLSKQDTSVRLPDGSLQKLTCDENGVYGIPAPQERRQ